MDCEIFSLRRRTMGIIRPKSFDSFAQTVEKDLSNRYPQQFESMGTIAIGRNKDAAPGGNDAFKFSRNRAKDAVYATCDSARKPYHANVQAPDLFRKEIDKTVGIMAQDSLKKYRASGMDEAAAQAKVKEAVNQFMTFDSNTQQFVMQAHIAGVNDSMLSSQSTPYWNIGYLNKVFAQPFLFSKAKRLVSTEGFGNAWADVVSIFTSSFEGYGRVDNTAKSTFEPNASSVVSSEMGQQMTDVINIAIDYETSIQENYLANNNPFTGVVMAQREKYAALMLNRMDDALTYFGNADTNTQGLLDVGDVQVWGDAGEESLTTILNSPTETAKGSKIVEAMNKVIGGYLAENKYMATEIKINCSTHVMQALLDTTYSQNYNPASPLEVIKGRFDARNALGQAVKVAWSLEADPMLDANTPFNMSEEDLMVITTPSVGSELGDQTGLVIKPELLDKFIVPALYSRTGMLYTMYKRVGGIFAPVEGTVKVVKGFGRNGNDA